jgi:hypothetical protein
MRRAAWRSARHRTDQYLPVHGLRAFPDAPRIGRRYCFGCTIGKEQACPPEVFTSVRTSMPVVWRTGTGPTSSGKLELGDDDLVLHGSGEPDGLRIPFDELSSVEIGRGTAERINGDKSLVLERHSCERVLVAALGGVGLLGELTDLLARLRAERAARACVAVVVPIKRGSAEGARRLVEEGPPFDVERLGLERHHVFVSEREVVFFFEGDSATAAVEALSRSPRVLKAAVRWRGILAGKPRLAEERFGWTRTS